MVRFALLGGVSADADSDDSYQRISTINKKATFTINEKENELRRQQTEESDRAEPGFFSFDWYKEDQGLPYEWAQPLEDGELEGMSVAEMKNRAIE